MLDSLSINNRIISFLNVHFLYVNVQQSTLHLSKENPPNKKKREQFLSQTYNVGEFRCFLTTMKDVLVCVTFTNEYT